MEKLQKYRLAALSSLYITLIFFVLILLFSYFPEGDLQIKKAVLFSVVAYVAVFISNYLIIRDFARKKLQKIFETSLFKDDDQIREELTDSNIDQLFEKIDAFVEKKQQEINQLHNRDDFRKEFLGNVSHELKTPLFTAQGYILTLLDGGIADKELKKKYLIRATKSIERLNFIVKDLDMISKLESGMQLDKETFNIVKLITDVFEILEIKAAKKQIVLRLDRSYEVPILVRADRERIEQVLINLISNSINYGKHKGNTIVSIKNCSKGRIRVLVKDDGIGMDTESQKRIFERFYRVDKSRSREQGGSGLGLAIVKHIVEAHGQQISVESTPEKGSVFSFTLDKVL